MENYKIKFAKLLADSGALFFAQDLFLKDGRPTPYFVNIGGFGIKTSFRQKLAKAYATMISDKINQGLKIDIMFGPAYKGIPLGTDTTLALLENYNIDLGFCFDRKEAKVHGEASTQKNMFVGAEFFDNCKIYIIDDVATSMGTKEEAIEKINFESQRKGIETKITGIGIAVDREQVNLEGKDAIKDFVKKTQIPVHSIVGISEVIEYLFNSKCLLMINGEKQVMDSEIYNEFLKYMETYGTCKKEKIKLSEKEQEARKRVCLPLDGLNTIEEVKQRVEELSPVVGLFKIGKESFTRFGPEIIKLIHNYGSEVFLDLKYHDIPNTVKGAAKAATELGVYMFNVHASGGLEMMEAAVEGANEEVQNNNLRQPKIIGVTILTSIDKNILNNQLKVSGEVEEQVLNFAQLANQAGLDGIVCSAADLYAIKDKLPKDFLYITPGIKGPNTPAGEDQKRVFTPGNAVQDGSSILVIGRAITGQPTPEKRVQAGYEILQDMAKYL